MAPYMKSLLLVAAIVVAMSEGGEAWKIRFAPLTVQIQNGLSQNQDLTLHCKSKDDDLGEHTLQNKATYEFKFWPRFFVRTTLFFCSFRWPSDTSLHYFDIYVEDRDWGCDPCTWNIEESGPCQNKCFPWNSPSPKSQ
ncbi:S-protein homolog 5-like [Neltuma alba]|uniref:S-protein homolog 5-like n=1 Tax=Neltuma alba TaxID=207710 RepID=UPI0010A2E2AC|nr:S-protein homolog 5-like [Prosopis alba]